MREKWQRVRELFERALEEQPDDLEGWLAREEPDDPDVRAEVQSLVENNSRADRFLSKPVTDRFPTLLDEDHPYKKGDVIGKYTIVRELGGGGMGRVYLATDASLGRNVALKALAPRFTGNPDFRERLRREALTAARLSHPGICTVFELYEHGGNLFIASEYVDGHTLREEIGDDRPPAGGIVQTARDIAAPLAAAHRGGIVHRDLKPENVMRTTDGRIKILDFGLARAIVPDADPYGFHTATGEVVGTPAYMAPEQLTGTRSDARVDVWAFGVMLYELASAVHPFDARSVPEVMVRVIQSEPLPIKERCPALPDPLCVVIERCLKKWPDQRFESASDVCKELEAFKTAAAPPPPIPAPPTPTPPLPAPGPLRWWRAHQYIIIGLYFIASLFAWLIKEELLHTAVGNGALAVFGVVSAAATVGGIVRGHLLFTERVTPGALARERRRTEPMTLGVDALIAAALTVDGVLLLAADRHLPAVLIAGLGLGNIFARLVIEPSRLLGEPSTSSASLDRSTSQR